MVIKKNHDYLRTNKRATEKRVYMLKLEPLPKSGNRQNKLKTHIFVNPLASLLRSESVKLPVSGNFVFK